MKNILIGVIGIVVGYFAADFQPITKIINESFRTGTVKGVDTCIDYSGSSVVSEQTTKDACTHKFQRSASSQKAANGRAGPRSKLDQVTLDGNLKNDTADFITTLVSVEFYLLDGEGVERAFPADFTTWIEPGSSVEFSVELQDLKMEDFAGLEFCSSEQDERRNCISWGMTAIEGVYLN